MTLKIGIYFLLRISSEDIQKGILFKERVLQKVLQNKK